MAKYTELLSEYLESGGQLPAALDTIDGFKNLFIGRYMDCEIGFETETLFAAKLEYRANLVMPYYVKRLNDLERVATAMATPSKIRDTTVTAGQQTGRQWTLPINGATDVEPSAKSQNDSFTNTDKTTETGYTPDEAQRAQEYYDKGVIMLLAKCLEEFKGLFMGVY